MAGRGTVSPGRHDLVGIGEAKAQPGLSAATAVNASPALICDGVWKVFGTDGLSVGRDFDLAGFSQNGASSNFVAAVQNVSLAVIRGEIFCIMGLSGSGKSTLVRCMASLLPITRGQLHVLDIDVSKATEAELIDLRRTMISMVFQDFALLPHLTVLQNIAFPLRVRGIDRVQREDAARKMCDLVGLSGREGFYPHELSGGQQQRVGIARSLTTDPQIWFLDEPFSALDPLIRQDMQDELLRLQSILCKTIVFISRVFDEAIRLASRIAIMRDGRIVQIGRAEELVLNPADDYVARFTAKVSFADVIRVGTVMRPGSCQAGDAPVPATALIRDVATRILDSGRAHPVADEHGEIVGSIDPSAVIDVLLRRLPVARW